MGGPASSGSTSLYRAVGHFHHGGLLPQSKRDLHGAAAGRSLREAGAEVLGGADRVDTSLLTVDLDVETKLAIPKTMVKKAIGDTLDYLADNLKASRRAAGRQLLTSGSQRIPERVVIGSRYQLSLSAQCHDAFVDPVLGGTRHRPRPGVCRSWSDSANGD